MSSPKKKILITGKLAPIAQKILNKFPEYEYEVRTDVMREELLKIVEPYHCIVSRSETDIDKTLIDVAKNLEVIARAAVGVGNIDVDYATQKGILVFNSPMLNTNSAAELTIGLLLAAMRKISEAHQSMQNERWNRHQFTGTELQEKTIGIVGLGNVGHRVAKFLNAFECKLIGYDPYLNEETFDQYRCKRVSWATLLKTADVITLHIPKNKETVNLITKKDFAKMKPGVVLINTARGGLVNEPDLLEAIKNGKVASAGIDTWDVEPVKNNPFKEFPQIVMTPHIGASTFEAQQKIAEYVIRETISAFKNGYVSSPVNLPKIKAMSDSLAAHYAGLSEKLGKFIRQFIGKPFVAESIEFLYRGAIQTSDRDLIKIAFLKGFFYGQIKENVSYVNALAIAERMNIKIIENDDKNFSDYTSAIRVRIQTEGEEYSIGGTIIDRKKQRLSYLEGMPFEIEPKGNILVIKNEDAPGVIGYIGNTLAENNVNINQFELARTSKGGNAIALLLIDEFAPSTAVNALKNFPKIHSVHSIIL